MNPPTGTVTFLLTDIEGSTKLWQSEPAAMRVALARHDEILRNAIEANEGFVFKTMGDAFFAAFASPMCAVAAMETAQRALADEAWPPETPIRVRMALHSGVAEFRGGDYFGQTLNRAARVLSAGHGGQSLATQAVRELIRDEMPSGAALWDLGDHRLKDLGQPERLLQINFPGLPTKFPELRSLSSAGARNNLPLQMTTFIGRERQIAEIEELLSKSRLLTLLGTGGCGKSRLALQVAASTSGDYPDGVWLAELGPLSDPAQVAPTVGGIFGLREEAGRPMEQTIGDHLAARNLLLILDNCEHLLGSCASLAHTILNLCSQTTVLTTSREPLGIAGERTYRVPSLTLPEDSTLVEDLASCEAVRLFTERTELHQAQFALSSANVHAVASICRRLDGIPLAVELAAARMRFMSAEEIDAKLDHRFGLLTGGSRSALPRQQTLRALIDWSYELLSREERSMLQRLSVFAGGWTLDAAEAVCAGDDLAPWQVLDLLSGLVDKSLVSTEEWDGRTRYKLLETVRQYGRDRLEESGEVDAVRQRHSDAYLKFAKEAEGRLHASDQLFWIVRLEKEHENLRTCWEWMVHRGDSDDAMRLCVALFPWWQMGYLVEGREWSVRSLEMAGAAGDPLLKARSLHVAGYLSWKQGDYSGAFDHFKGSDALAVQVGDELCLHDAHLGYAMAYFGVDDYAQSKREILKCLEIESRLEEAATGRADQILGILLRIEGDMPGALAALKKSIEIYRRRGDRIGMSFPLYDHALALYYNGDFAPSVESHLESLAIRRETGERWGLAESLYGLGLVTSALGRAEEARRYFNESLGVAKDIADRGRRALCLIGVAYLDLAEGRVGDAEVGARESLQLFRDLSDRWGIAKSFDVLALLKSVQGEDVAAAELWGAADQIRVEISSPLPPSERAMKDQRMVSTRSRMGVEAFAEALVRGGALPMDDLFSSLN